MPPPLRMTRLQINFLEMFLVWPSTKIAKWFRSAEQSGRQS